MYLYNTRPDIILAAHKIAQYILRAYHNDWLALRALRYAEGTIDFGIRYGRGKQ